MFLRAKKLEKILKKDTPLSTPRAIFFWTLIFHYGLAANRVEILRSGRLLHLCQMQLVYLYVSCCHGNICARAYNT